MDSFRKKSCYDLVIKIDPHELNFKKYQCFRSILYRVRDLVRNVRTSLFILTK